ncbi:hypothetical protein [Kitasatospora sp. NPDC002965]|uniref:hypothetical protein n=1 Tax=Kitasatospora sp. NPDC002965 TaxID=3154775 RepID=UPI0033AD7736
MGKYEDAVAIFASSTQTSLVDRGAVAGKDVKWTPGDGMGDATVYHEWKTSDSKGMPHDAWWGWNYHFTYENEDYRGSYVYGVNFDYSTLNAGSPFDRWQHEFLKVISPLRNPPFANDRFDVAAFGRVAEAHERASKFLEEWVTRSKTWVDEVDAPDGDWQGSAAGAFHTVLGAFHGEITSFQRQLADNGVKNALGGMVNPLLDVLSTLEMAFHQWRQMRLAHPANALQDAVADAFKDASVEVRWRKDTVAKATYDANLKSSDIASADGHGDLTFKVTASPFGDPQTKEFWEKVVVRGKEIWLANLARPLDNEAGRALIFLESAYTRLLNQMNSNHPRVALRMPPPVPPKVDAPPGGGGTGGGGTGGKDDLNLKNDLGGGPGNKEFKLDGGAGGGGTGGSGSGGSGTGGIGGIGGIGGNTGGGGGGGTKPPTSLPGGVKPPEIVTGGGSGGSGPILPGGGTTLPGGGTGGPGPGVHVPDLLGGIGSGGPGSGSWTGGVGGGTGGSGGRNVVVPTGSRVTEDGRVVDGEGRPVLDNRGNPMVVGRDYTIAPDGTLLDGRGNPVSESRQIIDDLGHSYLSAEDDLLAPNDFGLGASGLGGVGLLGSAGGGSGGSLLTGPGGISPITGAVGGTSARGLAAGGDPSGLKAAAEAATERMAAERAARAAAAEQAALTGRQVATSSGGAMPPMMPPGMGGGAGAGGNEKDRQRTTWLAEDEEVWGTESGAVEGVIGR